MKYFILITTLFISQLIYSQVDSNSILILPHWSIGDTYDFEITKIKNAWTQDSLTKHDTIQYWANFEVIDSSETSYTIKWSYKNMLSELALPEKFTQKASKYPMTEIIYETNQYGRFIGVKNWKEIRAIMQNLTKDLIESLAEESLDPNNNYKETMKHILALYESQEGIEAYVVPELNLFHFVFGIELYLEEVLEYEERYPNMFGGDPIKANAQLFLEKIDFHEKKCTLINKTRLNPNDTKKLILDVLAKMNFKDDKITQAFNNSKFQMSEDNYLEYLFSLGIPNYLEFKRETDIDINQQKARNLQTIKIKLLK